MKKIGLMIGFLLVVGLGGVGFGIQNTEGGNEQVLGTDVKLATPPIVRGILIPHHLLVRDRMERVLNQVECEKPCRVVFISPLHHGVGVGSILWARDDLNLAQQFFKTDVVQAETTQIEMEHTIQDVVPIIETQWQEVEQTQIMVSNYVPKKELDEMAKLMAEALVKDPYLKLVISVDFSHYLPVAEADKRDLYTLELLSTKDYEGLLTLNDEYVDGPKAMYVFLKALALAGMDEMEFLGKTNSGVLLNRPHEQTTSHFYAVFR